MIISSWPRLVIGTLILFIGAAIGVTSWSVATCSRDSAGSLWMGALALLANLVAWALLGRRVPSKLVLMVAAFPALGAILYSISTVQLATGYLLHGKSACAVIKVSDEFGMDGHELWFVMLWLLVCISFWGGLAPVVARAIRVYGGSSDSD